MKRKFPAYKVSVLVSLVIFIGIFAGLPAIKTDMTVLSNNRDIPTDFRELPAIEKVKEPETVKPDLPKTIIESNNGDETDISDMTTDFNDDFPNDNTDDSKIYRVYEEGPALITSPNPEYPETAKHLGIEGTVVLELVVEKNGTVSDVKIIKSIHPLLDNAAKEAALNLRFSPAMARDMPVRCYVSMPITFSLR